MAKVIDFLAKASNLKSLKETAAYPILRTHFMTKCWDFQSKTNIVLDESDFGEYTLCRKCGNSWSNKNNKYRIIKKEKRKKRKSTVDTNQITTPNNFLLKICQHCRHTIKVKLIRRKMKKIKPKIIEEPKVQANATQNIKKKKQKAKKKFAGLNVNAVITGRNQLKSTQATNDVPANDVNSTNDVKVEKKNFKRALLKSQHLIELFQ